MYRIIDAQHVIIVGRDMPWLGPACAGVGLLRVPDPNVARTFLKPALAAAELN